VAGAEGKNYMWFDAPVDTFQPQRMGLREKEKMGTLEDQDTSWFTL
jgi:hypothetical protein